MMRKTFLLLFLLMFTLAGMAQQQSSADLKKKQAEIQREIDDLKAQINETKKYKKKSLSELNLVQKKLRLRESQIHVMNDQIQLIQGNINQNWRDILKLRSELDTLKEQYKVSVVYAYKNRSNYDFLNFIFSSVNFNDALKRMSYLRSYRQYREQQAESIMNTQRQLEQKLGVLRNSQAEKKEALQEQSKQARVLEEEKKEKDAVVREIKGQEKELMKDMADKQKQDLKLKSAIKAAINREIALAKKEEAARRAREDAARKAAAAEANVAKSTTAKPADNTDKAPAKENKPLSILESSADVKLISDNFEKNRGSLPWPVSQGRVAMKFGRVEYEGLKGVVVDNPGITIEADAGSSVKAVFDGEVSTIINIGSVQGVIVKHGKYFTTYSNLSSVSVSKGQQVKIGQVLGKLDEKDSGRGELEFVITNDKSINLNPESWLR
ncbi:MAG TPA: peptidoglycan DD-metalloendopeptidase family protein [Flavihumibacter sp.]|nr:peptidoglycan DD-metalloendopeptidase family protein [Bacteroidota bacterium]HOA37585.1 peptidoglycan DD-metalloendopeptidase family protein [Flavihumibacter sp.]HPZ87749.1 peptidoglycan DD-metalloendopeptidase family protein [Flavihumibacter sp.]